MPTTTTPITDPATVQSALVRELAATTDPLDATTDREKQALRERRALLEQHIRITPGLIERRETPAAKRVVLEAALDRLHTGEAAIKQRIEDAPDWRTVADSRERDAEYDRQRWLADSLTALQQGVKYHPNGAPMLPTALREVLTPPPCAACQRPHEVFWPGPISALEAEITALDKEIAEAQFWLDAHLGSARALLGETAPVETVSTTS